MQMGALFKKLQLQAHLNAEHPELGEYPFHITWDKTQEPYLHAKNVCDEKTIERYANILESHIWLVVPNPTQHTLFTSDNPVIKKSIVRPGWRSYSGIASEGIQLIFPLSPRFSLSLLERHYWGRCEEFDGRLVPFSMEDANVDHDNSGQVECSTRFIFCSENDFDLARRFCAEFPDAKNPARPLVEQF